MNPVGQKPRREDEIRLATEALALAGRTRRLFQNDALSGFEPAEVELLLALFLEPDQSVSELAKALEVARPTVSNALRSLSAKGLVTPRQDPKDGRVRRSRLSPSGRRVLRAFLKAAAPALRAE